MAGETANKTREPHDGQGVTTMAEHDWRAQAACKGMDTNLWFPETPGETPAVRQAKRICNQCTVAIECLEFAMDPHDPQDHGIWGALGVRGRNRLKADQRRDSAAA